MIVNGIGMKLELIPKGAFTMGSPIDEIGRGDDETLHHVVITRGYYLGTTPVTQGQFEAVMGVNPSHFRDSSIRRTDTCDHPVECVNWNDAMEFCKQLSEIPTEKQAGRSYRLPTEAEWEHACRAGSATAFSFGDEADGLGDYAWYQQNAAKQTHPVGLKKPNKWGIYDMHGNVWEWCSDPYDGYPDVEIIDPGKNVEFGWDRYVLRGGSWNSLAIHCRSAQRGHDTMGYHDFFSYFGFRVAMTARFNE